MIRSSGSTARRPVQLQVGHGVLAAPRHGDRVAGGRRRGAGDLVGADRFRDHLVGDPLSGRRGRPPGPPHRIWVWVHGRRLGFDRRRLGFERRRRLGFEPGRRHGSGSGSGSRTAWALTRGRTRAPRPQASASSLAGSGSCSTTGSGSAFAAGSDRRCTTPALTTATAASSAIDRGSVRLGLWFADRLGLRLGVPPSPTGSRSWSRLRLRRRRHRGMLTPRRLRAPSSPTASTTNSGSRVSTSRLGL